jgi:hypothetical protein
MTAMPFSKTFGTSVLAQSHVAAEKHCSALNRAEVYAKKTTKLPIWPIHGLVTDRPVLVCSIAHASHISAEQYCEEFERGKRQSWMGSSMPICPEKGKL